MARLLTRIVPADLVRTVGGRLAEAQPSQTETIQLLSQLHYRTIYGKQQEEA